MFEGNAELMCKECNDDADKYLRKLMQRSNARYRAYVEWLAKDKMFKCKRCRRVLPLDHQSKDKEGVCLSCNPEY